VSCFVVFCRVLSGLFGMSGLTLAGNHMYFQVMRVRVRVVRVRVRVKVRVRV
jgi:hypothetical protein